MSVIAAAVKYLLASGASHEEVVKAVAEMEEATAERAPARTKHAEAQARYRERQKAKMITDDHIDHGVITGDPPPLPLTSSSSECPSDSQKVEEDVVEGRGTASPRRTRGTRLPIDWSPQWADRDWSVAQLGSVERFEIELTKFRDWWAQVAGQKGVKLDWDATWRTWVRRAAEQAPTQRGPPANGRPQTTRERKQDEWDAALSKLSAAADRNASGDRGGPPPLGLLPPLSRGGS